MRGGHDPMADTVHVCPTTHAGIRSYAYNLTNDGVEMTMGAVADHLWRFVLTKHRGEFDEYVRAQAANPWGEL